MASAAVIEEASAGDAQEETLELLLPQVTRFMAREVRSDLIDQEGHIPESVRRGAAALGLFGLTIPAEYGGAGLLLGGACRVVSEIARGDRSVAIMIGLHAGLGTRGLVEHGTSELKNKWLARLASGACVAAFAATEASAGSDLTAIATTGEAVEGPHVCVGTGGGGIRIHGEKSYVTNGGFAGIFTVLARTPGIGGTRAWSVVSIPREAGGVEIGREEDKLGIRGSSTVTVRFDGTTVPWSHVIGEPGRGMDVAHGLLAWGRTLMSAGATGTARAALDASISHVTSRRQFGRPIGEFGATRAHVAWMAARVHAMEAVVRAVSLEHARGESIETTSAVAKVFTSDSSFLVCDRALQLHGALGFLEPTGVARMLRDCRITRIFEGANDVLMVRIGAARLAQRSAPRRPTDVLPIAALAKRLDDAVADVRARLGIGAVRRQLVLQRLAAAEIAVTVGLALCASDPLGAYAAEILAEEGNRALDALPSAERDEEEASAIAARLYSS